MTRRLGRRLRWAYLIPMAAGLAIRCRLSGRRDPFASVGRSSGTSGGRLTGRPDPAVLIRAVDLATRWGPFRASCLVRSLVAANLLGRYGYRAQLVIGVPCEAPADESWRAHAWVEVGGTNPRTPRFEEIARIDR
jgi:hypothetical protein